MSTNDNKHLLLKGITLLLCESQIPDSTDNSADLVRRIVKDSVAADMIIGRSIDGEVTAALKKIAGVMVDNPVNHKYDHQTLVMDVKMACASDETITPLIDLYLEKADDEGVLKLKVINLRNGLDKHFEEKDIQTELTKASMGWKNDRDKIPSAKTYLAELIGRLEKYTVNDTEVDSAINFCLDMSDAEQGIKLVERIQKQDNGTHILKLGWQGLNRALDGGLRPGEQWVIGAQEHNWKTGFSLSIFRQVATCNDAINVRDETGKKQPALVRFSFEDSAEANMEFLFKSLWENETGEILDKLPEDAKEINEYVTSRMQARGWRVFLYDVNPSMWTYKSICNEILKLEARGFEVRIMALDYLLKIPTTGCDQGPHGVDIRNMFERIKAFCAPKKITMLTPHQLSPDAKTKAREGANNFVKEMLGGGYYSGTKQLGQVIDGEIFINIERDPRDNFYLTIQIGKHRKIKQTPVEHRYLALQFVKGGIIPDDIDKPDTTRLKVGGPTLGEMSDSAAAGLDF